MRREVNVVDKQAKASITTVPMADPDDKSQIGASIPGAVSKVNVKKGHEVKVNDILAIIEAMKMETSVTAKMAGVVEDVRVKAGDTVKAGELLITIK
jgi:pyruvate carboxylase